MTRLQAWLGVGIMALSGCRERWQAADIGMPPVPGHYEYAAGTLTLTGSGAGINVKDRDQCQFVSVPCPPGDFEVVARLLNCTGPDAMAGLMVRADQTATGGMVAVSYRSKGNAAGWVSRLAPPLPPGLGRVYNGGLQLAQPPPLWLRLVRMGPNFAAYKSRDGRRWVMMSNVSGGPLHLPGADLALGLFVAGGTTNEPATATFDSIQFGPARMAYKTSWVGNTFGSRPQDQHVSNALSAMWVAPDGTCYTSSYWDEGGRPVTSYRDGKAARGLPIGTPQTAEGAITGDDKYLYVAAVDRIWKLDPAQPDFARQPLALSVNLLDKAKNCSVVAGLASTGRELFVADWRDNLVRVVDLSPAHTYHKACAANDGIALAPQPVTVPADDPKYAPAMVYQTQRVGECNRYAISNLTAGAEYTVRIHFAEYVERPANADPRNRQVMIENTPFNLAEAAGGVGKAYVREFPGYKADKQGTLIMHHGAYGGPGICGFEILTADGRRVFALNCGGPPVGEFKGESPELVNRAFAFERPGAMVADKRGELWIVQRGNDMPIGGVLTSRYPAAVKCYTADGKFTGREIRDVVNPRALGYDAAKDELLVGENGLDLNVRIYGGLATAPVLTRTFGAVGGIYAGEHPGRVYDPAAGGYARFAGISGVGVDARGNLYVGGGFQGTDLRAFTPAGELAWMLNSLMFCNTYDFDPTSDGTEVYGTYNHVRLDLAQKEAGKEQQYVGYNWDHRRFGEPVRAGGSQSIVRRLGPDKRLVMYTSGQGTVGDVHIFRYEGELAIPCGGTREHGKALWIDANGDGGESPDELTQMDSPIGWITTLGVDSRGDIWAGVPNTGGSFMRHFFFKGVNDRGVPVYSGVKGEGYEDVRFPEEGDKTNAWGMACRLDYDADRDILVALYPAAARKGDTDYTPPYFFARYDNWSKGNRTPTWKQRAFEPTANPEYFMYEVNPFPHRGYMGMQMAGDYVFFAYLFGEVHVFNLHTGALVEILSMGPEVNGQSAWEDAAMGLRAFKRKNGEYLVLTENSGWGGKNNFFRWKPKRK